ncbi:transposase [Streptomyces noursei]|uniref:transposase n=1 Tax=Streptomyces noursei TaxID=1971 RepID=UPI003B8A69AC
MPWRDVQERYGPWARVYDLFRRWQRDGTWQRIFAELQAQADASELITWDLNIDSTACRAHQHAAGAREKGSCRKSCPAVSPSSRMITASGRLTPQSRLEFGAYARRVAVSNSWDVGGPWGPYRQDLTSSSWPGSLRGDDAGRELSGERVRRWL